MSDVFDEFLKKNAPRKERFFLREAHGRREHTSQGDCNTGMAVCDSTEHDAHVLTLYGDERYGQLVCQLLNENLNEVNDLPHRTHISVFALDTIRRYVKALKVVHDTLSTIENHHSVDMCTRIRTAVSTEDASDIKLLYTFYTEFLSSIGYKGTGVASSTWDKGGN